MTGTLTRTGRAGLGLAAGALAGLLAACGGGTYGTGSGAAAPPAPAATPAAPTPAATQVTADLSDFHIALSRTTFTAGPYTFTIRNTGHHDHALEIEGPGGEHRSKTLAPGASGTLGVTLKDGKYEVYCPVDGHKDLGMKTEITVGGAMNGY
ncbi:cupredoxin domain-containing protein [Streptomyces sp. NBC_00597]|uniref:cupredoxin domain-containing protein n=1 Tax=unclassified Streptomyces TaxID=2593676 RepID=UPI002E140C30|nr:MULTISPECIES: copper-binding protein [unclassified Streptomyces]WSR27896.1 cupredoxin domain-containing protein [Streptomyces sp. NBC_01205]